MNGFPFNNYILINLKKVSHTIYYNLCLYELVRWFAIRIHNFINNFFPIQYPR